ncbi:carbohydrate esterase family 4 protein [Cylindrobasidium torrendii FP15055 ss-10]|uniref:chitin deacetylase n=1 Tax=Cylindrobasidium torrendii FP15055 ss-10 TaxID=1314674 RepID=A0A0D7BH37_9AGAR|nr:carbohydrate esterase family 4 protein [Cylindrobasidium torrendii FP15055 ss-10]
MTVTSLSNQQAFAELYYTIKAIKLVTGVTPACWRPPFGDVDDRIQAIANGLGLETIVWTYDSDDWKVDQGGVTEETIDGNYQSLVDRANNGTLDTVGTIILTHELNNFTMQKAVEWYPRLKEAFTAVVPIAVAFNQTTPYAETDHTFPTFDDYVGNADSSSSASEASTSSSYTATGTGSASQATGRGGNTPSSSSAGQLSAKSNGATKASPTWTSVWLAGAAVMFFAYY